MLLDEDEHPSFFRSALQRQRFDSDRQDLQDSTSVVVAVCLTSRENQIHTAFTVTPETRCWCIGEHLMIYFGVAGLPLVPFARLATQ